jgi:hypothetical protein
MKGGGGNMKTKISVVSCFFVSLLMVFPMSAVADGMWIWWQMDNDDPYVIPDDDPQMWGDWQVYSPPLFAHDWCYVNVHIQKVMTTVNWDYEGDFLVGSGGGGDVDVECSYQIGDFYFEWDYDAAWPPVSTGTCYAEVYIEAWDEWPWPDNVVSDTAYTDDFYLVYP